MSDIATLSRPDAAIAVADDSRASWRRLDSTALLLIYLALQFFIPASLVLPGLGAAGSPARVYAVGLFLMWCFGRVAPSNLAAGSARQPVHFFILIYAAAGLVAYTTAWLRGVTPIEGRGADRYLLALIGVLGIALTACDGLRTRRQLDRVLIAACWMAGILAVLGIIEYLTHVVVATYVKIPGLVYNQPLIGSEQRGAISGGRVAGTALHYIEFAAVLSITLPLAMHYALHAADRRTRRWRWTVAALIAAGIPLAISRSGFVGLAVGLPCLLFIWRRHYVVRALLLIAVGLVAYKLVFPGVLGTIKSLFLYWNVDPSISGRTSDYATIGKFYSQRPWFGRGGGTFIPGLYITLDNEYLGTLVEGGLVGLCGLVSVLSAPVLLGRHIRRHGTDDETRHLGQTLFAMGIVGVALSGTFDSFAFPLFGGLLFLLLGVAGALYRLNVVEHRESTDARDAHLVRPQLDLFRWAPDEARRRTKRATVPAARTGDADLLSR